MFEAHHNLPHENPYNYTDTEPDPYRVADNYFPFLCFSKSNNDWYPLALTYTLTKSKILKLFHNFGKVMKAQT